MIGIDVHLQIDDTNLRRRPDGVPSFRRETHDPRTRIVNVDLRVARMHSRQRDTVPPSQLHEVLDRQDRDTKHRGMAREEQDAASGRKGDLCIKSRKHSSWRSAV